MTTVPATLWGRLLVLAGAALLLIAPHLAWNAAAGWPTWHHTADNITVQAQRVANTMWLASLGEWLGGQWLLFGPLWLALPLLLIGATQAIRSGAQLSWTAVVLLHLLVLTALPLVGTATRALAGPEALPPRTLDLWARMRGWEDNFAALATPARRPSGSPTPATRKPAGVNSTWCCGVRGCVPLANTPTKAPHDEPPPPC